MGLHNTKSINPHNVLNTRKCKVIPPYFTSVIVPVRTTRIESKRKIIKEIDRWIYLNLYGRYCIAKRVMVDYNNKIYINQPTNSQTAYQSPFELLWSLEWTIGFEEPSEASYFILTCSILNEIN